MRKTYLLSDLEKKFPTELKVEKLIKGRNRKQPV